MTTDIRTGGVADVAAIADLHAQCFTQLWDIDFLGRLLAQPGAFSVLATSCGTPVGFVVARAVAGEAEILSLGVRPVSRRRGTGERLVRAAADQASAAGALEIFLEVSIENEAASALYARLGFRQTGCRLAYYRDPTGSGGDALILQRALPLGEPPVGNASRID